MKHLRLLSKESMPATGISLLEKQAIAQAVEETLVQLISFVGIVRSLKG